MGKFNLTGVRPNQPKNLVLALREQGLAPDAISVTGIDQTVMMPSCPMPKKPMQSNKSKPNTKPQPAKPGETNRTSDRLRNAVPTRDTLAAHPWLKPIAHRVLDPKLWRMHHEAVARGAGIGIFWAFVLPAGQILVAAANSVWWRANIPVAVGVTLITNPFTIGFWLWLAYQAGSLVLDAPPPLPIKQITQSGGVVDYLSLIGAPALLGMGMFAVGGSVAAYALVKIVWRLQFWLKHKNRASRNKRNAFNNADKND